MSINYNERKTPPIMDVSKPIPNDMVKLMKQFRWACFTDKKDEVLSDV